MSDEIKRASIEGGDCRKGGPKCNLLKLRVSHKIPVLAMAAGIPTTGEEQGS
jgi:hypothetical protein